MQAAKTKPFKTGEFLYVAEAAAAATGYSIRETAYAGNRLQWVWFTQGDAGRRVMIPVSCRHRSTGQGWRSVEIERLTSELAGDPDV